MGERSLGSPRNVLPGPYFGTKPREASTSILSKLPLWDRTPGFGGPRFAFSFPTSSLFWRSSDRDERLLRLCFLHWRYIEQWEEDLEISFASYDFLRRALGAGGRVSAFVLHRIYKEMLSPQPELEDPPWSRPSLKPPDKCEARASCRARSSHFVVYALEPPHGPRLARFCHRHWRVFGRPFQEEFPNKFIRLDRQSYFILLQNKHEWRKFRALVEVLDS